VLTTQKQRKVTVMKEKCLVANYCRTLH